MSGPYVAKSTDLVASSTPFGNGQCVALVRALTGAPTHDLWRQGAKLADAIRTPDGIAKGTAIATFFDGAYPSHSSGNHAAIFVSAAADFASVQVFDQWVGQPPHFRTLIFNRPGQHSPSDRAEAFSIIL
jgi:hypothetical protein